MSCNFSPRKTPFITAIPLSCGVYNNCLFTKRDIYFILYLIGHSENPRQEIWYQMNAFYVSLDLSEQILLGFFLVFLLELLKLCQSSKTFKCQFPILSLVFFLSLFFVTAQKAFFIQSFFCYCEFVKQTGVPLTVSKKI